MSETNAQLVARLRAERVHAWDLGNAILEKAQRAGRVFLTPEEGAENQRHLDRIDEIDARLAELDGAAARQAESEAAFGAVLATPRVAGHRGAGLSAADRDLDQRFRDAILRKNPEPIIVEWPESRSGYQPGLERRLVSTGGGGMIAAGSFHNRLVEHLVENSAILSAGATMLSTERGEPLAIPKSTALSAATIVDEGAVIPTSDPALGKVVLNAYKYGFLTSVSRELAEDVSWDLLGYLAKESGQAIGNAFGAHAATGTGSSQPRGVVTDASLGVTGGTTVAGAFNADNLIDLMFSVAEPYARSASSAWLMRNSTLGAVRKLKASGTGDYLFSTDVVSGSGAAGTLLGRPVYVDPNVAAVGLGAKSVLFGDFSRYWVRTVSGLRFERSDDYAFNTDTITFRALWRGDGSLIDTSGAVKYFAGGAS